MAASKLFIADERMLKLMDHAIATNLKGITSQTAFCETVGLSKSAILNIRAGKRGFTPEHHLRASNVYGVDCNWMYGKTDDMFFKKSTNYPLQLLKEAVMAVETMINNKPKTAAAYKRKKSG